MQIKFHNDYDKTLNYVALLINKKTLIVEGLLLASQVGKKFIVKHIMFITLPSKRYAIDIDIIDDLDYQRRVLENAYCRYEIGEPIRPQKLITSWVYNIPAISQTTETYSINQTIWRLHTVVYNPTKRMLFAVPIGWLLDEYKLFLCPIHIFINRGDKTNGN